jgi:hypothetical protein
VRQVEIAKISIAFAAPRHARAFFEALASDNLDIGRPDRMSSYMNLSRTTVHQVVPVAARTYLADPAEEPQRGYPRYLARKTSVGVFSSPAARAFPPGWTSTA